MQQKYILAYREMDGQTGGLSVSLSTRVLKSNLHFMPSLTDFGGISLRAPGFFLCLLARALLGSLKMDDAKRT